MTGWSLAWRLARRDLSARFRGLRLLLALLLPQHFIGALVAEREARNEQVQREVGQGWAVAQYTLMNERVAIGGGTLPRESGAVGALAASAGLTGSGGGLVGGHHELAELPLGMQRE